MPKEYSRREFLRRLVEPIKRMAEAAGSPEDGGKENLQEGKGRMLSRREFLALLGALAATLAMGKLGLRTAEASGVKIEKRKKLAEGKQTSQGPNESEEDLIKEKKRRKSVADKLLRLPVKKDSYAETVVEEGLMIVAEAIAGSILAELGIETGNKSIDMDELLERLRDKPLETFLVGAIIDPIGEEALLRLLPSTVLDNMGGKGIDWNVGIPTSAIFALGHNLRYDEFERLRFAKSVPLSQFMAGLFFWYLMRERGFSHSLLAHSLGNSVALAIAKFLIKTYPPKPDDRIFPHFDN